MIDSCDVVEWLSSDTLVTYQVISSTRIMVCSYCPTSRPIRRQIKRVVELCGCVHTAEMQTPIQIIIGSVLSGSVSLSLSLCLSPHRAVQTSHPYWRQLSDGENVVNLSLCYSSISETPFK